MRKNWIYDNLLWLVFRCRHENEMEINKIINDQLTCGKCFKQFGSIQALKKHLEAKKCQGKHYEFIRNYYNIKIIMLDLG